MAYRLILFIFFISGAFGLGYQILWSKFLLDFIGVSAYSYATVLAAFMAGLAIGSTWLGKLADRIQSPLRLYALLELGVGVYAVAYLPLTRAVASFYAGMTEFTPGEAGGDVGLWSKVIASGVLLLPPTILLGGTFPAMVRHVTRNLSTLGGNASLLYALNAFGAVVGTLLMAFVVLPGLGMKSSLLVLGAGNLLVAAAAFLLAGARMSQSADDSDSSAETSAAPNAPPVPNAAPAPNAPPVPNAAREAAPVSPAGAARNLQVLSSGQVRLALVFILLGGVCSFIYEIAWTRFFGLVLGSSTYSFAIMLAAFITGIALGGAILNRIEHRIGNPLAFFGWTQLAVALLVVVPLPFYDVFPWLFVQYRNLFSSSAGAFYAFELGKLLFCYLVMLPPTILIGMAIPLLVTGLSRNLERLGADTGRVYAYNTWGSVIGSLVAGLLLLPALGMETLLTVTAIGNAAIGSVIVLKFSTAGSRIRGVRPLHGAIACVVITLVFPVVAGGWNESWFSMIRFRATQERESFADARERLSAYEVVLFEDDPAANLMVTRRADPTGPQYTLYVNGKADASSGTDLPTQLLLGHLPLLLHADPNDVLIVGLASGVTAGACLRHDVETVDVVELLRAMPEATQHFAPWNEMAHKNERCTLIFDDARSYLQYTSKKYDVIISEPSNPWMAGTGALYTTEFYRRAAGSLRPGGVYLQWLQMYEMSDDAVTSVIRSFRQTFPYLYGFQGNNVDLLLVGSLTPIEPNWDSVERRMSDRRLRDQLASINILDLPSFLFLQRFGPLTADYAASMTEQENTDDNHYIEYRAPKDMFRGTAPGIPFLLDERLHGSPALMLRDWQRETGGALDRLNTLKTLTDYRARIPQLQTAYKTAIHDLEGLKLAEMGPDLLPFFSDPLLAAPPLTDEEFFRRAEAWIARGDAASLSHLINARSASMLIASALSPEKADALLARSTHWLEGAPTDIRRVVLGWHLDVLVATGRIPGARRLALDNAVDVHPDRLLRLACRSGDRGFLTETLDWLDRNAPSPIVTQMRQLHASR